MTFSATPISSSSLFTQMRTAREGTGRGMFWARLLPRSPPQPLHASSLVRVIGCSRLRSAMARQYVWQNAPRRIIFSTGDIRTPRRCNHSAANWLRYASGSIRALSTGPSRINKLPFRIVEAAEKETPRLEKDPSILPVKLALGYIINQRGKRSMNDGSEDH